MERKLYTVSEVTKFIAQDKFMILTADEEILENLPKGNWIGGTIEYFIDKEGGKQSDQMVFVDDQTNEGTNFKIAKYDADKMETLSSDSFENGFTVVIIPIGSPAHTNFALHSLGYPDIFSNPVIGYVSGTNLDNPDETAKIFNGKTGEKFDDGLVALHVELPAEKTARLDIINIFTEKEDSDTISFQEDGLVQKECIVNGKVLDLIDYLKSVNHDTRFPMIANQLGARINKSFLTLNEETREVGLVAPVFKDETYKLAQNIDDYEAQFNAAIKAIPKTNYACNCVLNYLYGDFANKKVEATGATTFGEIAFQLLNQTMVYLVVE